METFKIKVDVRWADLDPNFHMLHSKYYDLGAHCRMKFFNSHGLTPAMMLQQSIGPILFSEQCNFRRELVFGDEPEITFLLTKARRDYSRWTVRHEIFKDAHSLAATIECTGAWINTKIRKLAVPPVEFSQAFDKAPKSSDFLLE